MFTTPIDFLMKISENDIRIRIRIRVIKSDPDPAKNIPDPQYWLRGLKNKIQKIKQRKDWIFPQKVPYKNASWTTTLKSLCVCFGIKGKQYKKEAPAGP